MTLKTKNSRLTTEPLPWLELCVCGFGLGALWVMVLVSRQAFTSDESWHLNQVGYVVRNGFGLTFFDNYRGSPGPLFVWLHRILLPVTGLQLPWVRLVNSIGFCLLALAMWRLAIRCGWGSHAAVRAAAATVAFAPLWKAAGLAYTEMAAILMATLSLVALPFGRASVPSMVSPETLIKNMPGNASSDAMARPSRWWVFIQSITSGGFLALAVLGRQPLLLMPIMLLVIGVCDRRQRTWLLVALIALPLPIGVFMIWAGLQPPAYRNQASNLHDGVQFVILASFYAAATTLLLRPGWFLGWGMSRASHSMTCWAFAAGVAAGIAGIFGLPDMGTRMVEIMAMIPGGDFMLRAAILMLGTAFLARLTLALWQQRHCPFTLMCLVVAGGLIGSHLIIGPIFSNRYMAVAAPFLILAWGPDTRTGWRWVIGYVVAIGWGAVSLWGHLDGEQGPPFWDTDMEAFYPHLWQDVPAIFSDYQWKKFDYGNSEFLRNPLVGDPVLEPWRPEPLSGNPSK